ADMRKRAFIVVRQPIKDYGEENGPLMKFGGRRMPWRTIELRTLVTPDIDLPDAQHPIPAGKVVTGTPADPTAYVVTIAGQSFIWTLVGTDWSGQQQQLSMPLVFVPYTPPQSLIIPPHPIHIH